MITLTENATKELLKIMKSQKVSSDIFLRVGIKAGGCSGFTYLVDFEKRKTRFDLAFESHGIKILVDKKSYLYIKGTEIDWSYNLLDRGLKFNNPKAKSSCGCKTSFMYEPEEKQKIFKPSWI